SRGDVVAISLALLGRMDRAEPITGLVEDKSVQEMEVAIDRCSSLTRCLLDQPCLDRVEHRGADDRTVFTWIDRGAMPNPSGVDGVGQHVVQLALANLPGDPAAA